MALEIAFFATGLILLACLEALRRRGVWTIDRLKRFSVRDVIVVTTLVAAGLGIIAYAVATKDKDLGRFWWIHDVIERENVKQ